MGKTMAVTTFAAIDIGSYEVSMKIFEMSKRIGFREMNDVSVIGWNWAGNLCGRTARDGKSWMNSVILNDFKRMMAE